MDVDFDADLDVDVDVDINANINAEGNRFCSRAGPFLLEPSPSFFSPADKRDVAVSWRRSQRGGNGVRWHVWRLAPAGPFRAADATAGACFRRF